MKKKDVRNIFKEYISDLSGSSESSLIVDRNKKIIDELCIKALKNFKDKNQIEEYLDFVVEYIKGLNKFFVKKKRSKISYTKLFNFANKDERISEFIVNKKISSKKEEKENEKDIAGFSSIQDDNEEILDMSSLSIKSGGFIYKFIWIENGIMFFFSVERREILVQFIDGKIMSYVSYKKKFKKNKFTSNKFVGRVALFRKVSEFEKKTDTMQAFLIYIRQERAKVARRKFKKRIFDS